MIDMSKMNKILEYDKENFVVRVEAGVLLNDLAEDAQSRDCYIRQIQVKNLPHWVETYLQTQVV